ncbi:hypothetical protein QQF64_033611 [Cirrhinus molitorella]|uniref:Uncharacterized protein n=1 Tax=Cirrhinus molitorella TaxID=172907 RepID=A0ABR3MUD7_9TELE
MSVSSSYSQLCCVGYPQLSFTYLMEDNDFDPRKILMAPIGWISALRRPIIAVIQVTLGVAGLEIVAVEAIM